MQERSNVETVLTAKRPLIMRALRRSKIRKKIADYLFEISPSGSYTSEIAYHTKTTPTNVLGALRGMGTRYKKEESLLTLNIIELVKEENDGIKLYRITDFGREVLESIQER
ncbi:MAG: archaellum operon transcriptional activator EarA family protein [Euryarchaeota archaeon]|nr:archaellum operon transcriptional activator EarA family protein [Euryarchaeota archaeon]